MGRFSATFSFLGAPLSSGRGSCRFSTKASPGKPYCAQKAAQHPESRIAARELAHRGHFTDGSVPPRWPFPVIACLTLKACKNTARTPSPAAG